MGMEGQGFNVDVWINGVKCMLAIDSAQGGCFEYQSYAYKNPKADQIAVNTKLLEDYIDSLPEYPMEINGEPYKRDGKVVMMKPDMDNFIDDLIIELQKAKEAKKMTRLMKTSFIFGVPNADRYDYVQYRRPLAEINRVALQKELDKMRAKYCKGNVQLLNTNISALELK